MEDRTVSDYSELRRLAEAATPGPWYVQKGRSNETCGYVTRDPIEQYQRSITGWGAVEHRFEDAAYIAAASPDVVLGLLSDLAAANRRAEGAERERRLAVAKVSVHVEWVGNLSADVSTLREQRDAARAEADKYRLWWESSQDALRELMHEELPAARAEAKALRKGLETIRDMGIGTVIEHQARAALRAASAEGQEVPNA
jgi:hypothetical protein